MERFVLTKTEQKQLKLIWHLLSNEEVGTTVEEIQKLIDIPESSLPYYIEKIYKKVDEIFGEQLFKIRKVRNRVFLEIFTPFSFQVLKSGYMANSFFMYFFQEIYHKRFINLAKTTEKRFISYETGKREVNKCRRYLYQFALDLCKKRKVADVIEGRERAQRFMYFSLIMGQFGHNFRSFFEETDERVTEFLKDLMAECGILSSPSLLKLEVFYHISFDRMKQGSFLMRDLEFPDYIPSPFLSLEAFCVRIVPLFETLDIADYKIKAKEMEMLYFCFSTLIVGMEMQDSKIWKGKFAVPKSVMIDEFCRVVEDKYFKLSLKEKSFIGYGLYQYVAFHRMFGVAYDPYLHLFPQANTDRISDELWGELREHLSKQELFRAIRMSLPTLEVYLKDTFQTLLYYKKKERTVCRLFLCIYSSVTYQLAVDKLRHRLGDTTLKFVHSTKEADIIISEMTIEKTTEKMPIVCSINNLFNKKDWKSIDIAITEWENLQDKTRQDKTRQDKTRQDKTRQINGAIFEKNQ